MVQGMFCGLVLTFVCYGVFALNTGQHERSLYCISMVYFWCLFGNHNSCEVLFISALEINVCCGDQNCIAKSKIKKATKTLSIFVSDPSPIIACLVHILNCPEKLFLFFFRKEREYKCSLKCIVVLQTLIYFLAGKNNFPDTTGSPVSDETVFCLT